MSGQICLLKFGHTQPSSKRYIPRLYGVSCSTANWPSPLALLDHLVEQEQSYRIYNISYMLLRNWWCTKIAAYLIQLITSSIMKRFIVNGINMQPLKSISIILISAQLKLKILLANSLWPVELNGLWWTWMHVWRVLTSRIATLHVILNIFSSVYYI